MARGLEIAWYFLRLVRVFDRLLTSLWGKGEGRNWWFFFLTTQKLH